MSRTSPLPSLREGTSFTLSTDTHLGEWSFTDEFVDRAGLDLDSLSPFVHGHVHTGDCIHWAVNAAPEDDQLAAWMDARRQATDRPWVVVPGNHDLASFTDPSPWRTDTDWATATGQRPTPFAEDIGDVRVLAVAPETWKDEPWGNMTLSPATLSWIDGALSANSRPTFLAMHSPLDEQYGATVYADPASEIAALIGSHSNLVGVLSGHLHVAYRTNAAHAAVVNVGGRNIFCLNGPATGGRMSGVAVADHQWQSPVVSIVATYLGDRMQVRWRSHLDRVWDTHLGSRVKTLALP